MERLDHCLMPEHLSTRCGWYRVVVHPVPLGQRLGGADVERGPGDRVVVERGAQRVLVDEGAPGDVAEVHARRVSFSQRVGCRTHAHLECWGRGRRPRRVGFTDRSRCRSPRSCPGGVRRSASSADTDDVHVGLYRKECGRATSDPCHPHTEDPRRWRPAVPTRSGPIGRWLVKEDSGNPLAAASIWAKTHSPINSPLMPRER